MRASERRLEAASPLDRLAVRGIRAYGHHGVLPEERREGQEFVVDVVLGLDSQPAADSDELAATVDYAALADSVGGAVETDPVDLIETLAQRIAHICLESSQVAWVEVTVHKPHAPVGVPFDDVTITILRRRK